MVAGTKFGGLPDSEIRPELWGGDSEITTQQQFELYGGGSKITTQQQFELYGGGSEITTDQRNA